MTLIPRLTTELRVVSMEHLQRMWNANKEHLTSEHLVPSRFFGLVYAPIYLGQISRTCRVFNRLFTLNAPRYFLEFASFMSPLRVNVIYQQYFIRV